MNITQIDRLIDWQGNSGKSYEYSIFPISEKQFPRKPGNYIFAQEMESGIFKPLYIAHSIQLQHEIEFIKSNIILKQLGLTHIHLHINWSDTDRLLEVKDLISEWNPVCNKYPYTI
jgi:hypothetical protein